MSPLQRHPGWSTLALDIVLCLWVDHLWGRVQDKALQLLKGEISSWANDQDGPRNLGGPWAPAHYKPFICIILLYYTASLPVLWPHTTLRRTLGLFNSHEFDNKLSSVKILSYIRLPKHFSKCFINFILVQIKFPDFSAVFRLHLTSEYKQVDVMLINCFKIQLYCLLLFPLGFWLCLILYYLSTARRL